MSILHDGTGHGTIKRGHSMHESRCTDICGSERNQIKKKVKGDRIKFNKSWFLFYGKKLNMTRQEIRFTRYGEMLDMITCLAIDEGRMEYKAPKKKWRFEEVMKLQ